MRETFRALVGGVRAAYRAKGRAGGPGGLCGRHLLAV